MMREVRNMVKVMSTKNASYNEFFAKVVNSLDQYFEHNPKIVVVALPDNENKEIHLSTFGVDSYDLFDAANICQHEAIKDLVMSICTEYIDDYFNGELEEEDGATI